MSTFTSRLQRESHGSSKRINSCSRAAYSEENRGINSQKLTKENVKSGRPLGIQEIMALRKTLMLYFLAYPSSMPRFFWQFITHSFHKLKAAIRNGFKNK